MGIVTMHSVIAKVSDIKPMSLMSIIQFEVLKMYPYNGRIKLIEDVKYRKKDMPEIGDVCGLRINITSANTVSIRTVFRVIPGGKTW